MTEERAKYEVGGKPMAAVRLENFRAGEENWKSFLHHRLFARYPGARVVARRPQVALVELNSSAAWSPEDEAFFAEMRQEGYFQRWEPLADLPPRPKHNTTVYADIGYRVASHEPLTPAQQEALLSQLHDLEERALRAEREAEGQRVRADDAVEHASVTVERYNALVYMLEEELELKTTHNNDQWTADDTTTGRQNLLREKSLPALYRKAIRLRRETKP